MRKRIRKVGIRTERTALAIQFGDSGELPREFRLFVAGWNDTEKGRFLFDAEAAAAVKAAYEKWDVDRMIDLEHLSLDKESVNYDPDARGWCKLEVREDGSLWATEVSWTPDGQARLTEKRQRYVSPAFNFDLETMRVTSVFNIAICAVPATHGTPALVAASAGGNSMTVEEFLKVCKALGIETSTSIEDALAKIKGEPAKEEPEDAPASEPAAEVAAEVPVAAAAPAAPAEEEKKDAVAAAAELAAALTTVARLSGKSDFVASLADIKTWHASHLELESGRQKLAAERATLESAERRRLCVELVSLAGKAPSTVWADDKATKPKQYLADMPIESLRALHADEIRAKGGKVEKVTPPAGKNSANAHGLSDQELAICTAMKCDPAAFAALKNTRDGAKGAS